MKEFVICPRCGEELEIKERITDRDWSRQVSYFASHKNNLRCAAGYGIRYFTSKDTLINSFENRVNFDAN